MSQQRQFVEAEIDADGEWTAVMTVWPGVLVAVSISGTWSGTIKLQRRFDGANWRDVQTWTGSVEATYLADAGAEIRLGFDASGFGSGAAVVRLQVG